MIVKILIDHYFDKKNDNLINLVHIEIHNNKYFIVDLLLIVLYQNYKKNLNI